MGTRKPTQQLLFSPPLFPSSPTRTHASPFLYLCNTLPLQSFVSQFRRIKGVAKLADTLISAVPAMSNVASLCFLVIFIFTVMGMEFYGFDQIEGEEYVNGMYNQHVSPK